MKRRTIFQGLAALAVVPFLPKSVEAEKKEFNVSGHITAYFPDVTIGDMDYKKGDYVFMQFPSSTQTVKITRVDEKGMGYYKNIWGYEVPLNLV